MGRPPLSLEHGAPLGHYTQNISQLENTSALKCFGVRCIRTAQGFRVQRGLLAAVTRCHKSHTESHSGGNEKDARPNSPQRRGCKIQAPSRCIQALVMPLLPRSATSIPNENMFILPSSLHPTNIASPRLRRCRSRQTRVRK